jgi:HK97 family phage prohead protease
VSTRDLELSARRERAISIEFRAAEDSETFRAALSSDAPIRIWSDLDERLIHTAEAIDLSRAVGGLPLLFAHDQRQPIGRVDNLAIEGGILRGDFTFAPNAKAQEIRADVAGGFLRNVSIGYRIHEWIEKDDGRLIEATRWELLEASIVSVPADPSVGLNRAADAAPMRARGGNMPDNDTGAPAPEFTSAQEIARRQGIEEGRRAETERRNAIDSLFLGERFQAPEFQAIRAAALTEGRPVDWAKDELLRAVGAGIAPIAPASTFTQSPAAAPGARYGAGDDAIEKFMRGAELQISVRAGL